jgi:anhydro-N-acetylmuramic acid kinase
MSGTSLDGVDAVCCRFRGDRFEAVTAFHSVAFPSDLRAGLLALQQDTVSLKARQWLELDQAIAEHYVRALAPLVEAEHPVAVGMHGQTVAHWPERHSSLQLGNAAWVAARLGVPVVHDFRRADLAQGGQGAPLVPAFHRAALHRPGERLAVVNVGGIANLSLIEPDGRITGGDLGPGNALLDEWIGRHRGQAFDEGGAWAATGRVDAALLAALAGDPWFAQAFPRSTGRDRLSIQWVQERFPTLGALAPEDVQASLLALTVGLIAEAVRQAAPDRLLVCGGGARNGALLAGLGQALAPLPVATTATRGLDPQAVEAAAFAWLARERWLERPVDLCAVTGARRAARLGAVHLPP